MSRRSAAAQASTLALALVLDRATKAWAMRWLYFHSPVVVLPFFRLTYVENTGAAFGLMQGANRFFIGVSVTLLAGLAWVRRRLGGEGWALLATALVAAGAFGNLYDRLVYGHVIDFLDFRVWPVFNVADSCISVGAVGLAVLLGREEGARAPASPRP